MYTVGIIILILIPFLIWKPKPTLIIGGGLLIVFIFVFYMIPQFSDNDLTFIKKISDPSNNYNYCLFKNGDWLSDPDFIVYRIEKKINPRKFENVNQMTGFKELLRNYEEYNKYTKEPDIKIVDNRFLVFSRGGYNFGLYDLKIEKDTFNNCCPFSSWGSQNIWAEKGTYYSGKIEENEKSDYGIWIEKNIHNNIKDYIENNKK